MKNKLELFVDKVNEFGGYAEIFKTKGKVQRIIALFSLNKPFLYAAKIKYGCVVISEVFYKGTPSYELYGHYAAEGIMNMQNLEDRLYKYFAGKVPLKTKIYCPVGKTKDSFRWYKEFIDDVALALGYYSFPSKKRLVF